jgi:hypothetical protein
MCSTLKDEVNAEVLAFFKTQAYDFQSLLLLRGLRG